MFTQARSFTKGVIDTISATVVGFAILILTLFSVYTVLMTVSSLHRDLAREQHKIEIRITGAKAYTNGTIYINITNYGPIALEDVRKIEIIATVIANDLHASYLAVYGNTLYTGYWSICGRYVGNIRYDVVNSYTLRPGESLCIKAVYPLLPLDAYVSLVVYTSRGEKTEFVAIVGD